MRIISTGLALVTTLALGGCMFFDDTPDPATSLRAKMAAEKAAPSEPPKPVEAAPPPPAPKTLSDAEIMGVLHAANDGELAMAAAAKKQGAKGDVKAYASALASSHADAAKKAADLEKKTAIKADASAPEATTLQGDANAAVSKLADAKGKDFDRAFVEAEVAVQQALLDTIDGKLVAAAKNDDVKAYVATVRASVADHLAKAQELQKKLTAAPSASTGSAKAKSAKR